LAVEDGGFAGQLEVNAVAKGGELNIGKAERCVGAIRAGVLARMEEEEESNGNHVSCSGMDWVMAGLSNIGNVFQK